MQHTIHIIQHTTSHNFKSDPKHTPHTYRFPHFSLYPCLSLKHTHTNSLSLKSTLSLFLEHTQANGYRIVGGFVSLNRLEPPPRWFGSWWLEKIRDSFCVVGLYGVLALLWVYILL